MVAARVWEAVANVRKTLTTEEIEAMNYLLEYRPVLPGPDPDTGKENQGLKGIFHIPAYQRGYRWTRHEVSKLLDDLAGRRHRTTAKTLQPAAHRGEKRRTTNGR